MFNAVGLIRIDLQSRYEDREVIGAILQIANDEFYQMFDVKSILTKAFPAAEERIAALKENGYVPSVKKLMTYDNYFVRTT